jgi:DNA-binding transcriptional MerR regulator
MKPKELSEKTGLKERTIRFYEEQGLLSPQKTRQNGRSFRDYSQEDADRLTTIATLRRAGFTLEEIRTLLNQPEAVETIYPGYLQRVEQEATTAGRLLEVSKQIRPNGLDAYGLARQLERSAKFLDLPPADMEPHFGRLDSETPEEKARAIEAYRSRKPGPKPQTVALAILGILCLCLLLTCAGMYRSYHPAASQPETAESTEGWLYYVTQENGEFHLWRYGEDSGENQEIYTSRERLSALAYGEKVYVSDGTTLYSMNADGSGVYRMAKNFSATGGGRLSEGSGRLAVYDGAIYGVDTTVDFAVGGSALARIPLSGGQVEDLDIATGEDFAICDGVLYADFYGDITLLDLDSGQATELTQESYTGDCRMGDNYIFQAQGDQTGPQNYTLVWHKFQNGSITTSESMTLPERTTSLYAHGSRLYYVVAGVEEPDRLWAYDAATGETGIITDLTEYTGSLDVFFGENGMYVPNAVGESYIPY